MQSLMLGLGFMLMIGNVLLEKCNNSIQNEVKRNLCFV